MPAEMDEIALDPLLNDSDDDAEDWDSESVAWFSPNSTRSKAQGINPRFWKRARGILVFQTVLNVALISLGLWLYGRSAGARNPIFPEMLYSPAQKAISYLRVKMDQDSLVFRRPPSAELDAAWMELTRYAVVSFPRAQAELMPKKTRPTSIDRTEYIAEIDVFHQLHCLNGVRMAYHRSEYQNNSHFLQEYGPPGSSQTEINIYSHVEHCVENIRQSLMCSADMTPVSSHWRTCRDWDRILTWGKAHAFNLKEKFDSKLHIVDNLVDEVLKES